MAEWDDILDKIIVAGREWWETWVEEVSELTSGDGEFIGRCPYPDHEDSTPSFNFNVNKAQFICHGCGKTGNAIQLYAVMTGTSISAAKTDLRLRFGLARPEELTIEDAVIEEMHTRLISDPEKIQFLQEVRGLSLDTINRFKIGYENRRRRFSIPIREGDGYVNAMMYQPGATKNKFIAFRTGLGKPRIWPIEAMEHNRIVLCEGHLDLMILSQHGFNVATFGSANGYKEYFGPEFEGKEVTIIYDIDAAGVNGSRALAESLIKHGARVRVVRLPISEPDNADVTDWFVYHGRSLDELKQIIEDAPWITAPEDEPYQDVSLSEASHSRFSGKRVRMKVIVAGKDTTPWLVPAKARVECTMDYGKSCPNCPVYESTGTHEICLEQNDESILEFVGVKTSQISTILRQIVGIPIRCNRHDIVITERLNLEEVRLVPEIDYTSQGHAYVARQAFIRGHGTEANKPYVVEGRTIADPRTQYATHMIHKAMPAEDGIDKFEVTPELIERLKIFQATTAEDMRDKLKEIYRDFEYITGIVGRRDLFLGIDLVFHSIIGASFQRRLLGRSWVQGLVIGDTRCGKTEAAKGVMSHYRNGEFISAESVSFAGLVGGISKIGSRFTLQWGKIPLADRRLVILDEVSGMSVENISAMSSVRSSGIAEVTKIQTERTRARTRMLWLSNPRPLDRTILSYTQGVLAIPELIGRPEDISRFDFAVSTASGEVPLDVINAASCEERTITYGSDLCHELVMWCWSRDGDDVELSSGTEKAILDAAEDQGKRYSASIPLVEPAEQRDKLFRLSLAVAARFFSTDETCTKVIVTPEHVNVAHLFLEMAYNKQSMGYGEYSEMFKRSNEISNHEEVSRVITDDIRELLLSNDSMYASDLANIFGVANRDMQNRIVSLLVKSHCLRRTSSGGYVKTEAFTRFVRSRAYERYRAEDEVSPMIGWTLG